MSNNLVFEGVYHDFEGPSDETRMLIQVPQAFEDLGIYAKSETMLGHVIRLAGVRKDGPHEAVVAAIEEERLRRTKIAKEMASVIRARMNGENDG